MAAEWSSTTLCDLVRRTRGINENWDWAFLYSRSHCSIYLIHEPCSLDHVPWLLLIEHRNPSTPGVWKQQESALGLLKMFFLIDIFKVQFYSSFVFTWCSVGQRKGHFVVVCRPHLMYFFYLRQYASPWHSHFCNFIPTEHKAQTATASNQYWILP